MKNPIGHSRVQLSSVLLILVSALIIVPSCSAPVRLTPDAHAYMAAKDMFGKGNFDRAAEFTDDILGNQRGDYTERAQMLRIVILAGEIEAYKELADAYEKGSDATKKPEMRGEFRRLRGDNLSYWSRRALELARVAGQLSSGGSIPKDLVLEAPYPAIEGPVTVSQLVRVQDGGSLSPEDETAAARDAVRKNIDNVLAQLAGGGDRAKARSALAAGPVKIDPVALGLYLTREVITGAASFDRKHQDEPAKSKGLYAVAEQTLNATEATLKTNPNSDQEKVAKKLTQDLKTAKKTLES